MTQLLAKRNYCKLSSSSIFLFLFFFLMFLCFFLLFFFCASAYKAWTPPSAAALGRLTVAAL